MGFTSTVYAKEGTIRVKADSQSQMSSEPEHVTVKDYGNNSVRTQNFDSYLKIQFGICIKCSSPNF